MTHEGLYENQDPHSLIGGSVHTTEVCHIDWLAFSLPYIERSPDDIPYARDFAETFRAVPPRRGYTRAIEFENKVRMDWHPDQPRQGVGFVYTGEALRRTRLSGTSDRFLVNMITKLGASFSRIDIAVNIALPDASAESLREEFDQGRAITGAKAYTFIEGGGTKKGSTFYLGSRTSERMLRFYNKAAQMGMDGITWWRAELEMKGRHAQEWAKSFKGVETHHHIKGAIRSFVDFTSSMWWVEAMSGDEYTGQLRLPRTESNTMKWLQQQVLPALQKLSIDDTHVLVRFFRAAAVDRGLARWMELSLLEEIAFKEWERSQGR